MRLLNYNKAEREKRLNELLEFIDLKHKKDAYPHTNICTFLT
jgi:D-methionine transport system ATP-binding protein